MLYAEDTAVSKAGVVIVCEICNQVGAVTVDKEVLRYKVTGLWTGRGRGCPGGAGGHGRTVHPHLGARKTS